MPRTRFERLLGVKPVLCFQDLPSVDLMGVPWGLQEVFERLGTHLKTIGSPDSEPDFWYYCITGKSADKKWYHYFGLKANPSKCQKIEAYVTDFVSLSV